ncbi:MAG TPA: SDR family oxidoreductase [Ohtaekwangia sp.]|nr:SDR family oxidoreductase [Ohtaekwangia sp.]
MKDSFGNKVAVVTGAGQGIGFSICKLLAERGARVVLNDKEQSLAEEAARKIQGSGGMCVPVAGDAGDVDFIDYLTTQAIRAFGSIDIAIANAGITLFGPFLDYTEADFQNVMRVNLQGSFFLAQHAARIMKEQKKGGSILFMSSVTGHQAHRDLAAYGMSKAALEMLAKTLVIELAPFGITVNAVAPGATLNERTMNDPEYKSTWSRITPMGRPAETADVANAVVFLVSPEARHITGQTLIVDGGWCSVSPSPYDDSSHNESPRSSEH